MRTNDFQPLLLRTAVTALACDGNIDQAEVDAVKQMAENEIYFLGYEYQQPFDVFLETIKARGRAAVEEYLSELKQAPLNNRQKLLLVEVLIRVIDADDQWAQNEKAFLHMAIGQMQIPLEDLIAGFPKHADVLSDDHSASFDDSFHDVLSEK
ncbi:MAG: TerB family tellurite resistance protein [Flavobacteriales bacterium]|nr:MAG: TerB family tellurite resistance protein [Flavobacteriales bacterium]